MEMLDVSDAGWKRTIAASATEVKYATAVENGPGELSSPVQKAAANFPMTGSPDVSEMDEMEPIWGNERVARSVCTLVHCVTMCSWIDS